MYFLALIVRFEAFFAADAPLLTEDALAFEFAALVPASPLSLPWGRAGITVAVSVGSVPSAESSAVVSGVA